MDINPMMLLPLLMQNGSDGGQNNENLLKMMDMLKNGANPNSLMDMLPMDDNMKKMLGMMQLMNGQNTPHSTTVQGQEDNEKPNADFIPSDIMSALNILMKEQKNK